MLAGDKTTAGMTDILPLPLLSPPIAGFVLPGNGLEPRRHSTYTTIFYLYYYYEQKRLKFVSLGSVAQIHNHIVIKML